MCGPFSRDEKPAAQTAIPMNFSMVQLKSLYGDFFLPLRVEFFDVEFLMLCMRATKSLEKI